MSYQQSLAMLSPVCTQLDDHLWRVDRPNIYPGPFSLVIPSWVGAMCSGNSFGHGWEEMASSAYISVIPASRTAGILAQAAQGG